MPVTMKNVDESKKQMILLSSRQQLDHFMHAFDVFSPSKRLAGVTPIELTVKPNYSPERVIEGVVNAARENGSYVVACFIVGEPRGIFVDETCQVISTGTHWGLLKDFLAKYGIEYEYKEPH